MAGHRYWRLFDYRVYSTFMGINEIELRLTAGGANQVGSGTAFASGSYQTFTPDKAFNLITTDQWEQDIAGTTDNSGYGSFIGYDFGVGVTKDINEILVWPDSDFSAARTFALFMLQSSDDNATWQNEYLCTYSSWVAGTPILFTRPTIQAANRYWGLLSTVSQTGQLVALSEFQQRIVAGGASVAVGGTAIGFDHFGTQAQALAFDADINTYYAGQFNAPGGLVAYDYGAGITKSIVEYQLTARNDASFAQGSTDGYALYSQDGKAWNIAKVYTGLTYAGAASAQIISISAPATSTARVGGLFAIVITLENELPKVLTGFNLGGINHGKGLYIQS